MLGALVIVFREVFEIALVVCVVLAATKDVPERSRWVLMGIALGTIGACFLSLVMEVLLQMTTGEGKQIFNACVLFIASGCLAWTVLWMQKHGRDMSNRIKQVGKDVLLGDSPIYMLGVVVSIAVLREGSEIVLFLYGLFASGDTSVLSIITGSLLGLLLGVTTGAVMYFGLLQIPVRHMFSVMSVLLSLLSAGMLARGIGKLVSIHVLPPLVHPLWDTSGILSQQSLLGKSLMILMGYQERPDGIQMIFYAVMIALLFGIPYLRKRRKAM